MHDVLIVGGGPAGAATAYWLAEAGHDVCMVDRKTFPREKTCGDALTPRAVQQLPDMALGTSRRRDWPYGTAIRGYWESPHHDDTWIESALDVKDRNGNPMPGYGWIFPVGDGTVNIGVGLLSTFKDFKGVNTTSLLREY